ncbi:amidohydrolase [Sphingobium sp. DC-2]|uniref:amidohydrolase n=1 Tax=Sphingobium sp. DC-2 TaxID=1303256 RepID=UPI000691129C|nr:amidohydrolase [Sphingobium sp. DC-2]
MQRKYSRTRMIAALLALSLPSMAQAQFGAEAPPPPLAADLILKNGHVWTPQGWAKDVVISKGVIIAVGDGAAAKAAPGGKVIDLKGKTVLPGLHDLHVHPMSAGLSELQCQIEPTSTMKQALDAVAGCVKGRAPGEWIVGRAYEPAALGETPSKGLLDRIAPNNPVLLTDVSIHSSWANSAALKLAGITRDTPNPEGGIIERDAKGEPTGVLREAAANLVRVKIPPSSRTVNAKALQWALDKMLFYGITGFEDALVSRGAAQAYADLADAGQLKQHVRACMIAADQQLIALRQVYARQRFDPGCVKILTDGVPTDGHTAAMLEDYVPHAGPHAEADPARAKGLLLIPPATLNADVVRYDGMGLVVKMHAAGDAAVRESLDAIQAAREAHGFSGLQHEVAHASFVAPDDLKRARAIGATLEFSPYIWSPSPIVDNIVTAVGDQRMKRWIPIREALDAGVFAVAGSDWNVIPSVNPWAAIETLVTRRAPGGGGEPAGPAEAITLKEAVRIFTIDGARQLGRGDETGTIETGKRADLVIIDRDIFNVPITTVHDTRVLMTLIDGEVAYQAPGNGLTAQ